jgi:hypothetical protein
VDEVHRRAPDVEAQVERKLAHELLGRLSGVGERPLDGELPDLAVVRRDVRAAAVVEIARDRVVVVAVDRRDRALLDQRADLARVRPVADEVAAAVHALDPELVDTRERSLERRQVGVDVGDDRDPVGHAYRVDRSIDECKSIRVDAIMVPAAGAARAST